MLLINPPVSYATWCAVRRRPNPTLLRFSREYERAVLAQPWPRIEAVLKHLTRGLQGRTMDSSLLHHIVRREMMDRDYELSGKVARLVVLLSFAESLEKEGVRILAKTARMLSACSEAIPSLLLLAIDDHFGVLRAS